MYQSAEPDGTSANVGLTNPMVATSGYRFTVAMVWVFLALMTLPSFWVLPAMDDWVASVPLTTFRLDYLMPNDTLWRPFQHLFRFLAHWFPYPAFAHAMNGIGHGIAIRLVFLLAIAANASRHAALLGAFAYCVSPAVGAAVWSVDSENQIWSNVCGLASAQLMITTRRSQPVRLAGWIAFSFLSVLWNEGGIAWFATAPILKAFVQLAHTHSPTSASEQSMEPSLHRLRQVYAGCAAKLTLGLLCVATYFAARFLLLGRISLGVAGARYGIEFSPFSNLKHIGMLLGMASTTTDTLAWFSPRPNYVLGTVTLALGLPFTFGLVRTAFAHWSVHQLSFAVLASISVVFPFAMMGHVSEMYALRPAAILAVVLAGTVHLDGMRRFPNGWMPLAAWLALAMSVVGNSHKLMSMVNLGRSSVAIGRDVVHLLGPTAPSTICAICDQPTASPGYSVFEAPPGLGSGCGLAARMHWGWYQDVDFQTVMTEDECTRSDAIKLRVQVSGELQLLGAKGND